MASIERHRNKWKVRYWFFGEHRAEVCETRQEAITLRAKIELAQSKNLDPRTNLPFYKGTGVTSEEALAQYKEWSNAQGRSSRTLRRDLDTLPHFLADCPTYVSHITSDHISHYMSTRTTSAATWNNSVNALRSFWRFLIEVGYVKEDPTAGMRRRRLPRKIPSILTSDEIQTLIEGMPAPYKPFTRFIAVTGCRVSEAIGLLWKDVALPQVIVRAPKERHDKLLMLPPMLCKELESLTRHCDHVFVNEKNEPMKMRTVQKVMEKTGERTGLPSDKCHWHNLRHTAATNLVLSLPVPVVQRMLGHQAISTTERYVHIAGIHLAGAASGALQEYAEKILGDKMGGQGGKTSSCEPQDTVVEKTGRKRLKR